MDNDAPETILTNVVALLEEYNKIFKLHRRDLERLFRDNAEIKQRLDKLESGDSLDTNDAKFLKEMYARLEAISTTLDQVREMKSEATEQQIKENDIFSQ
jgi:DNA repair ATPase RecN